MSRINWHASETVNIEPFRVAPAAFSGSGIRLSGSEDFSQSETVELESLAEWNESQPELLIDIDARQLAEQTGVAEDELLVSLVIRDRSLNRFFHSVSWPLSEIPLSPVSLDLYLKDSSWGEKIDICLYLTPKSARHRGERVASSRGAVLGKKVFRCRHDLAGSNFPKRWVSPAELEEAGYGKETLFAIHWRGTNLNAPPQDLFQVWLNEELKAQYLALDAGDKAGQLLQRMIAAEILTELVLQVLRDETDPDSLDGLIQVVSDALQKVTRMELPQLREEFQKPNGFSKVRAWVHDVVDVNTAFSRLNFRGIGR